MHLTYEARIKLRVQSICDVELVQADFAGSQVSQTCHANPIVGWFGTHAHAGLDWGRIQHLHWPDTFAPGNMGGGVGEGGTYHSGGGGEGMFWELEGGTGGRLGMEVGLATAEQAIS